MFFSFFFSPQMCEVGGLVSDHPQEDGPNLATGK